MQATEPVRIDKWLWAARVFKTRALATEACRGNKVEIKGAPVKPARPVQVGEVITIRKDGIQRVFRVLGQIERRVSGQAAKAFIEDLTPPEELARLKERIESEALTAYPKGWGRPTKKDRRKLDHAQALFRSPGEGAGKE